MKIFNKINLFIDEKEILRLLGYKDKEPDDELIECIRGEIEKCTRYLEPIVYYQNINIKAIENNCVYLENDVILEGEFITNKLKDCNYIIATVTTIGDKIDKLISEAFDCGDYLEGMVRDHIGTAAVGFANKAFWNKMVDDIKGTNLGMTSTLSPGDTAWKLHEQTKIFQCIGENFNAVTLTDSCLMLPVKSTSSIYGFGKNIGIARQGHICTECSMKHCSYRMDNKVQVIISNQGDREIIDVEEGKNLLEILRENEFFPDSPCSGKGICGKCKVKVKRGLQDPTSLDMRHLTKEELENGFRLSCNFYIKENTEVVLGIRNESMDILVSGEEEQYDLEPVIKKIYCQMDKPSVKDQRDDYKRLSDFCKIADLEVRIKDLPEISTKLRDYDFNTTATIYKNKFLYLEEGDSTKQFYGAAIDIGTTTIAVYLLDFNNGGVVDVESAVNMQRKYGADVISRINFTIENPNGLEILKSSIVNQINFMLEALCSRNNIKEEYINDVTIAGNTIMIHLLLGLPCENIALAPYIPVITKALEVNAEELGVKTKGIVSIVPGISAYVGSDITAGILSCGMLNSEKYSLLLDLGTNGEIALGSKNEIITCSTAAGPAFEGANIKHGIGGIKGAICKIDLSQEKIYETIGGEEPLGICGSGVLDAVAQLVKYGIVDETGRMVEEDEIEEEKYKNRLVEIEAMRQFVLAEKWLNQEAIAITQKDVREVQLAKAAINAGIKILLKEKNLSLNDIEKVYIGGGFGNFMNIDSAVAIGMIPKELQEKVKSVGNCAGSGAKMYLLSKKVRDRASELISRTSYIELSTRGDFQDYFVDAMMME
jgi:uncharacterized 2Fe-2S/4Fe-4S cluster protein (DUF4445 family)